jgi:hypothetical protein
MSCRARFGASDSTYRTDPLEEHCVDTHPERRTEEYAEENASGSTTPVVSVSIEWRRLDARRGCDDGDPEGNLRLSNSIRRHRAGCHSTRGATHTPSDSMFIGSCLRTEVRIRLGERTG